MLDIIIGTLFIGAVGKLGVDKILDVKESIETEGIADTLKKEAKNVGDFVSHSYKQKCKEIQKESEKRKKN